MSVKKNRNVGTEIEAYCTKCKIDRLHVISTLKSDGNINRVLCRTCDGEHLYRLPKGDGTKKPVKRRPRGAVAISAEDLEKAIPYRMDGTFEAGDIIQHKTFGPGSVREVRSDGKMDVGFATGRKVLISRAG